MLDLEVKQIAKQTWVMIWNVGRGSTQQTRTHGAIVQREWNRTSDIVEVHCYLCKRINDCTHAFDVARAAAKASVKT